MKTSVSRKSSFNAAHRLANPQWSDDKNKEVFGKCSSPNYHGHNYTLFVKIIGEPDPETGFVYDLGALAELVRKEIEERFDHRNLNLDTEEFKTLIPTVENIARVIYDRLRPCIQSDKGLHITLYETERNFAEYPA